MAHLVWSHHCWECTEHPCQEAQDLDLGMLQVVQQLLCLGLKSICRWPCAEAHKH